MLWLLSKIYYIMINDHVHCFDNQRFYEWETDLPAVVNWIVKKALAMMISFKICLRIVLQFCFLFNQEQKKKKRQPKGIYFVVTSIWQVSLEELTRKSKGIGWFISAISCLHDLSARVERHPTRVFNHVNGGMSPTLALCFQVLRVMILTSLRGGCVATRTLGLRICV